MDLALEEARKGLGRTAPNPPVGAVIVKHGSLLGSGWHRAAGRPHAEREAIANAVSNHGTAALRGATIYVTLEPCSSHGRTPPCTDGLIEAGISRVVYAMIDPDPRHAGRADGILKSAGIEVTRGVREQEATRLLRPFVKARGSGLPWIVWKCAMSLDGRITRPPGEGQWLSGAASLDDVQVLRSQHDAILTSGETVRRDRPALTIRRPELCQDRPQPWRVIFSDFPDDLPADAPLLSDAHRHRTLIRPRANPRETLAGLVSDQGVLSAMIEAGGTFGAAWLEEGLIDEVVIYLAPLLCGGPHPAVAGEGLPDGLALDEISFREIGSEIRCQALVRRS